MIVDTSGLLAASDDQETVHGDVLAALAACRPPLVVSPLVVAEVDHLLRRRRGGAAARAVLRSLEQPGFAVATLDGHDLSRAADIDERYADLRLGVVDVSLVVLAERYDTVELLTLDERHFRAVTPLQGGAFRLLPVDA